MNDLMIKNYVTLIRAGRRALESVPVALRDAVEAILDEDA